MIGTLLNAALILLGGMVAVLTPYRVPTGYQYTIKTLLGFCLIVLGFHTLWTSLADAGNFATLFKDLFVLLIGLSVGRLIGRFFRIQKQLNHLGQFAQQSLDSNRTDRNAVGTAFKTTALLFCLGPLAIPGAIRDGLADDFKPLAIKAVMDGLATMDFVATMGWGAIAAALPVLAYQGTLSLISWQLSPFLEAHSLADPVHGVLGFLFCGVALIILGGYRIELGDYLPSLILTPALAYIIPF